MTHKDQNPDLTVWVFVWLGWKNMPLLAAFMSAGVYGSYCRNCYLLHNLL